MNFTTQSTPVSRGFSLKAAKLNDVSQYVRKYKHILAVVAVIAFAFYWYEIRPIHINNACVAQAGGNARTLLETKARIATDAAQKASFENMIAKNLYLRSDYESFYTKCLRSYGMFGN